MKFIASAIILVLLGVMLTRGHVFFHFTLVEVVIAIAVLLGGLWLINRK